MDWTKFNTHGESNNHAFEVMCNILFENWCRNKYSNDIKQFSFVNGSGGDGGVEAYCALNNGDIIAVQSKWFPNKLENSQITQIKESFETALNVRPNIKKYIVCIPRDLGSLKVGRGKTVVKNTEFDKWNNFIDKERESHSDTEILLWDETRIQEKLTQPSSIGIYTYWFEQSLVFDDQIESSFKKATMSWAKSKYIPKVYSFGDIHKKIDFFLGSIHLSEKRNKELLTFVNRLNALNSCYKELLQLGIPDSEMSLKDKISTDINALDDTISKLNENIRSIKDGVKCNFNNSHLKLECTLYDFKQSTLRFGKYFHLNEIEKLLDNIEDDYYTLFHLLQDTSDNRLIILGNQGTGKTAGIVAEIENLIKERNHLPILVHAKDFSTGSTWLEILVKTIGLSNTWNEKSLLNALQTSALVRNQNNSDFSITPNFVICVDGLDESESWQFWKDKIDEAIAYNTDFPRIKFIFLSRPYVFNDIKQLDYSERFFSISSKGDVPVEDIVDQYLLTYKVDIGSNTWIKKLLKTPDSVRMFCDIYKNKTISFLPKNTAVITNLYQKKIEDLDNRFCKESKEIPSGFLTTSLIEIAEMFLEHKELSYEIIERHTSSRVQKMLGKILSYLTEEGFLYTYKQQDDVFSAPKILYSWGNQPSLDYLLAIKLYQKIKKGNEINIEYTNGIYQMLSLISIEDGQLLFKYPNVKIENEEMFELVCYALRNCSIDIAKEYIDYVKYLLSISAAEFREVVNQIIIPVSSFSYHPLGASLLDEVLNEFDSPSKRDIWWSIPAYLRNNHDTDWQVYSEIDFDSIELTTEDKYLGKPLILAWSLTSVMNNIRKNSRMQLINWGIKNPIEYWNLFIHCHNVNDIQMIEDLFAITFGICLDYFITDEYLITASNWMIDNVFSNEGLVKFENIAIRYYASSIVKVAISKHLIDDKVSGIVNPPYRYEESLLPLYKEATTANRFEGFRAIDYDLARYVLCDELDYFFRKDPKINDYSSITRKYIQKYCSEKEVSKFNVDGFIISCAYQFLLNQGWNEHEFWSNEKGVDTLIRYTYNYSTHGSMSKIMSVAEKNIWLAKHKIQAVLSNAIPYYDFFNSYNYIDDYSQLDNFINPYQDYINYKNRDITVEWINMDLLASPEFDEMNEKSITEWVCEEYLPNFDKWLSPVDNFILLNTFTKVQNNLNGVEESIWISSGAIKADLLNSFLESFDLNFDYRTEFENVSSFHATQDCHCYCTPQEACLVHANQEINHTVKILNSENEIEVYKLVNECISSDEMDTERYFTMPSVITRNLTNIIYGDGFKYFNCDEKVIAKFYETGENWGTMQKALLVDSTVLSSGLKDYNLKLFWLFRDYRIPSSKARERFENIKSYSDRTFIVWNEDDGFKYMELKEIKPASVSPENNKNIPSELQEILEKYNENS